MILDMRAIMPKHHPDDELLMQYAAGALPESLALIVATHVGSCERCQAMIGGLEAIGGACMDDIAPISMSDDALASMLAMLDEPHTPAAPRVRPEGVPSPLDEYLDVGFDQLRWRGRKGGIQTFDLDVDRHRTMLLHIPAGAKTPMHSHRGNEYTQVVQGAFLDATGEYCEGDFVVTDSSTTHQPGVIGDQACICLAVLDAPIKLTGPRGWLLNPFLRR
jgi:putative transcriptional regulator